MASAAAQSAIGTVCLDSTTPRTERQISVTGWPLRTASVICCSPSRATILEISPGRPRIRSDMVRSRSTDTRSLGSASPSDWTSTRA